MLKSLIGPFKTLDKRVKVAIAASGITNFGSRMTMRYDPLYAKDLGASPVEIGLLTSISSAVSTPVSIFMGWFVDRYSVKRAMLLNLALFFFHLSIMGLAGNWLMLLPAYIISTRLLRMPMLADLVFVACTEPQNRSTVISLSRIVWGVLNVFAPIVTAFIVTYFGGINAQGIRPLYFIELAIAISMFLLIARYLPPTLPGQVNKKDNSGLSLTSLFHDYREILREKYVQRWVTVRFILAFGSGLASSFTTLYLVEYKGIDAYTLGIIGSTSLIVRLVLQIPGGRLADKFGRKKVYFMIHPVSIVATFLAIQAPGSEYLILSGILGSYITGGGGMSGGGAQGVSGIAETAFTTMFWEAVPTEKRGRLFGLDGVFGIASIPASIVGGLLWQQGFITQVLLIPMLINMIIVMPIMATIPDRAFIDLRRSRGQTR